MAMASHELKNPLTAVKIYYQILAAKLEKNQIPDSAWRQKFDKELNRVISLMHEYLDPQNTMDMQLIYSKKLCSLLDIITRAVENVSASYPNHTFQVVNRIKQHVIEIE